MRNLRRFSPLYDVLSFGTACNIIIVPICCKEGAESEGRSELLFALPLSCPASMECGPAPNTHFSFSIIYPFNSQVKFKFAFYVSVHTSRINSPPGAPPRRYNKVQQPRAAMYLRSIATTCNIVPSQSQQPRAAEFFRGTTTTCRGLLSVGDNHVGPTPDLVSHRNYEWRHSELYTFSFFLLHFRIAQKSVCRFILCKVKFAFLLSFCIWTRFLYSQLQ